jgi:hypothetical protein
VNSKPVKQRTLKNCILFKIQRKVCKRCGSGGMDKQLIRLQSADFDKKSVKINKARAANVEKLYTF